MTSTAAQAAYEAYAEHTGGKTYDGREMPKWADLPDRIRGAWGAGAAKARTVQLDETARDLRRQLDAARQDATAHLSAWREASAQLDRVHAELGRAALRIAELERFEGSQAEAAMSGAQEVLALRERAEKAERERDEARAIVDDMRQEAGLGRLAWAFMEAAQRNRDAARSTPAAADPTVPLSGVGIRDWELFAFPPGQGHDRGRVRVLLGGEEIVGLVVERKPPFAWTDEQRAKLVPGASVVWYRDGVGEPKRCRVLRLDNDETIRLVEDVELVWLAFVPNCDPDTIEPPATQAQPAPAAPAQPERPPAPDLRKGDRVKGHSGTEWRVAGSPQWNETKQRWDVPMAGVLLDMVPAAGLVLSTRVRTWQPGEVVPHAPQEVKRRFPSDVGATHFGVAHWYDQPLAEPWTQTGIVQ